MLKNTARALLVAALATGLAGATQAATARNSQAGAFGSSSNTCAPTPYFAAGGCLSAAIADEQRSSDEAPMPRHTGRRLTAPTGPVPPPAD